jgi:hypothetical protein
MAGQPRSRGAPTRTLRQDRPKRRTAQLKAEMRVATSAADRLMAAVDFVRGALKRRNPDQAAAERQVDDITRQLIAVGTELLKAQAKEPRRRAS